MQSLGGLCRDVDLRSCLLFADEETEAWSHQVAGGKVKRRPEGLALMMLCSCHLMAERLSVGVNLSGLSLSQEPSLTRSEGPVSQTPRFPTLLTARLTGWEGRGETLSQVVGRRVTARVSTAAGSVLAGLGTASPHLPGPSPLRTPPCHVSLAILARAGHPTTGPPQASPQIGTTGLWGHLASFEALTAGGAGLVDSGTGH